LRRWPWACDRSRRSEPARSTRCSAPRRRARRSAFVPVRWSVKTACDRDDTAFISVDATQRCRAAQATSASTAAASAGSMGRRVAPSTKTRPVFGSRRTCVGRHRSDVARRRDRGRDGGSNATEQAKRRTRVDGVIAQASRDDGTEQARRRTRRRGRGRRKKTSSPLWASARPKSRVVGAPASSPSRSRTCSL